MQLENESEQRRNETSRLKVLFKAIREEIDRLDELDLTDVHPSIVFKPLMGTETSRD